VQQCNGTRAKNLMLGSAGARNLAGVSKYANFFRGAGVFGGLIGMSNSFNNIYNSNSGVNYLYNV